MIFNDPVLFTARNGKQLDKEKREITREIPTQIQASNQVQAYLNSVSEAFQAVTYSSVAGGFFFKLVLNLILGMINTLQLLVLLPLFKVRVPANAATFFSSLMEIAAFDFVDTSGVLDWIFYLEPTEAINGNMDVAGFESIYIVHNFGTLLIFFLVQLLRLIFAKLCRLSNCEAIKYYGENLHRQICYKQTITLITEGYFVIAIGCLINLKYLSWGTFGQGFMSVSSLICLVLLIGWPFGYLMYLRKNFEVLGTDKELKAKHAEFYEHLDLR